MHPDHDPTAALALDAVAEALAIDPAHVVTDAPNGFTWWAAPGLRQHVRVDAGAPGGAPWLRIETPVWRGADPQAIEPLVTQLGFHARGAAVRQAPGTGDVSLVTRVPLPGDRIAARAAAFAGTGAIQAYLAAWAWGQGVALFGPRRLRWDDALPHPELGFATPPDRLLAYRKRVLQPLAQERSGDFAGALAQDTVAALERSGVGHLAHRRPDGLRTTFVVDLGPMLGRIEVGPMGGAIDAHSVVVAVTADGHLEEAPAKACAFELLRRQLAPGAAAWTLGSWMPMPRLDDRPGFGVTHGLFVPVALAEPGMGPELAAAAARTVDLVRAWFADGAPAAVAAAATPVPAGARMVA